MTITTEEAERLAKAYGGFWGSNDVAQALRSLAAERDALQARVAELEEMLFGLLETFKGVGFRIGKTYPPRTASYEEAEQHYAKNYQGETALFMYQQWCQWRMVCMARAALEGKKE